MTRRFHRLALALLGLGAVVLLPANVDALNPVHECAYCHNLHGAPGGLVPRGATELESDELVETLCYGCHDGVAGGGVAEGPHVETHRNLTGSGYAPFWISCRRCHDPHDGQENWLGTHTEDPLADKPVEPTTWQASTSYSRNDCVIPTVPNGRQYCAGGNGTSGATEPVWTISYDGSTSDGGVTWTTGYQWVEGKNIRNVGRLATTWVQGTDISVAGGSYSSGGTGRSDFTRADWPPGVAGITDGQWIIVTGFANSANNGLKKVTSVTPTTLTVISESALVDESAGNAITMSAAVTIKSYELDVNADWTPDVDPTCQEGGTYLAGYDNECYVSWDRLVVMEQLGSDETGSKVHAMALDCEGTPCNPDLPNLEIDIAGNKWDGACEACHTRANHHRNADFTGFQPGCDVLAKKDCGHDEHNDGRWCSQACHPHASGFMKGNLRPGGYNPPPP